MFRDSNQYKKIYLACGYTDLRFGIDGLAQQVQCVFELDPFDEGTLFLFCGRKKDRIKGLLWEGDGFLLLYKRLENGRFQWPMNSEEMKNLTSEQFERLVSGLSVFSTIERVHPKRVG
jgi:transposase